MNSRHEKQRFESVCSQIFSLINESNKSKTLHSSTQNMPRIHSNPPPLPENLSERMHHTIDKSTGCCVYHPTIRMAEYVDEKQRLVFRRKTCFQCGARPGSVGGKNHMPGRSIRNPNRHRLNDLDRSNMSLHSSGRSSRSSMSSRDSR